MIRTLASSRRCTFPYCNNTDRLHHVERKIRFKALKENKICIPDGARVCEQHLQMNLWSTLMGNTEQLTKFSAKHVEDMIELLTDTRLKIAPEFPGSNECLSFVRNNAYSYFMHCAQHIYTRNIRINSSYSPRKYQNHRDIYRSRCSSVSANSGYGYTHHVTEFQ